ncbi:hypothetical protein pb186bvf_017732 [Paramecium bursaria]
MLENDKKLLLRYFVQPKVDKTQQQTFSNKKFLILFQIVN